MVGVSVVVVLLSHCTAKEVRLCYHYCTVIKTILPLWYNLRETRLLMVLEFKWFYLKTCTCSNLSNKKQLLRNRIVIAYNCTYRLRDSITLTILFPVSIVMITPR